VLSNDARRTLRRVVFVGVILLQLGLIVRAYHDPHRTFGFQMFAESSTWRADIVRVTVDGRQIPIDEPWPGGYTWPELVHTRRLTYPAVRHAADTGIDATIDFLDKALDYVATHTPDDDETRYLEATVEYWHNTRGPSTTVLRSEERSP